jgi:hypothetical protein
MTSKERSQNTLQEYTIHITPVVDKIELEIQHESKMTHLKKFPTITNTNQEPSARTSDFARTACYEPETLGTESHEKFDFPESDGTFARFDPDGIWMIRFGSCSTFLKRYLLMR